MWSKAATRCFADPSPPSGGIGGLPTSKLSFVLGTQNERPGLAAGPLEQQVCCPGRLCLEHYVIRGELVPRLTI